MRDEDFFYEGAERGDLLDALNGHAHEGSTTVLEGEPGSGVSTLLGMLAMALVEDYELIRLDGAEDLGANAVVDAMLVHFGIEREELADTLKQTLVHSRLVILLDNADQVPAAALATMASLKHKLGHRLAYVFGGAPGCTAMVRNAGLAVADTLSLPPLNAGDAIALSDEFFGLALEPDEADELLDRSQGRLGPLLALIEERTGGAGPDGRKPLPWRHALAVGALLLVVLVLWLASGDDEETRPGNVVALDLPSQPAQTVNTQGGNERNPASRSEAGNDQDDNDGLVADPQRSRAALAEFHDNAADFEQAEAADEPLGSDMAGDDAPSTDGGPVPPAEPESGAPTPTPRDRVDTGVDSLPAERADATDAINETPDQAGTTVRAGQPELSGLDARLGYRQEDWLATRGDDEWFLQLVATGREDGARGVLDQIDREGAYYRTQRGGKTVYVVLAGPYPSHDAAAQARDTLPDALRRGGPFPREMTAIRNELR